MHLYIHIPFCKRKCSYCDFVSGVYPDSVQTKYISALIAELAHIAAAVDLSRTKTIYIGGGTPSCLSSFNLERLLDALGRHLPIDQLDEYTIECNPESVDRDFVSVISRYGIDRVSMGIQSARREELLFLNRLHDFETAKKAASLLRAGGIRKLSVDLIFVLPGQSLAQLAENLRAFLTLEPEHISCYSLIVEENTPLMRALDEGRFAEASDEEYVEQYRFVIDYLAAHGYAQYEISNFAKPGFESIHNSAYWIGSDYLGLGTAAHSKFHNHRFANVRDLDAYIARFERSDKTEQCSDSRSEADNPRTGQTSENGRDETDDLFFSAAAPTFPAVEPQSIEQLTAIDRFNEAIFLGLRRNIGIDLNELYQKAAQIAPLDNSVRSRLDETVARLVQEGLLKKDDRIALTQKGRELSNFVFVELMI